MSSAAFDPDPEVSVVIPAYDEAGTIERTVERTREALSSFLPPGSFEVIVAEDGCTDRTPEIAAGLAARTEGVRHVHSEERLGRGAALERAFAAARGDTLAYIDSDLATDLRHLEPLIEHVRSGRFDVATGSRWIPGREVDRPAKRALPSLGFNLAARWLLGSTLHDHQCGFKAISRDAFETLVRDVEGDHWFWDTELLVAAQDRGYSVREFPVEWTPKGDTKVDLVSDVFGMGGQLLRCFWERSVSPHLDGRGGAALGLVASVGLLAVLLVSFDPSRVLTHLRSGDLGLVALAAALYALSWPLRGARYRSILAAMGYRVGVGLATGAVFISQTGNLVFPARAGDAARAYLMKAREGVAYPTGAASLVVERLFDLLTITGLAGAVLVGLAAFAPDRLVDAVDTGIATLPAGQRGSARLAVPAAAAVGALAVLATVGVVAAGRSDGGLFQRLVGRIGGHARTERIVAVVERFLGDVRRVSRSRGALASVGVTSVAIWSIDVATALTVFYALDVPVAPLTLVAVGFLAVSVGNLAKVLPLSPSGIGLYEAVFTLVVVAFTSAAAPLALGVAIVDHAVKNAVTGIGGVVSAAGLNVPLRRFLDERPERQLDGRGSTGTEDPTD